MSDTITYVLVEVEGAEDAVGVKAAIENLSNAEHSFYVADTKSVTMSHLDHYGTPVIYFP